MRAKLRVNLLFLNNHNHINVCVSLFWYKIGPTPTSVYGQSELGNGKILTLNMVFWCTKDEAVYTLVHPLLAKPNGALPNSLRNTQIIHYIMLYYNTAL